MPRAGVSIVHVEMEPELVTECETTRREQAIARNDPDTDRREENREEMNGNTVSPELYVEMSRSNQIFEESYANDGGLVSQSADAYERESDQVPDNQIEPKTFKFGHDMNTVECVQKQNSFTTPKNAKLPTISENSEPELTSTCHSNNVKNGAVNESGQKCNEKQQTVDTVCQREKDRDGLAPSEPEHDTVVSRITSALTNIHRMKKKKPNNSAQPPQTQAPTHPPPRLVHSDVSASQIDHVINHSYDEISGFPSTQSAPVRYTPYKPSLRKVVIAQPKGRQVPPKNPKQILQPKAASVKSKVTQAIKAADQNRAASSHSMKFNRGLVNKKKPSYRPKNTPAIKTASQDHSQRTVSSHRTSTGQAFVSQRIVSPQLKEVRTAHGRSKTKHLSHLYSDKRKDVVPRLEWCSRGREVKKRRVKTKQELRQQYKHRKAPPVTANQLYQPLTFPHRESCYEVLKLVQKVDGEQSLSMSTKELSSSLPDCSAKHHYQQLVLSGLADSDPYVNMNTFWPSTDELQVSQSINNGIESSEMVSNSQEFEKESVTTSLSEEAESTDSNSNPNRCDINLSEDKYTEASGIRDENVAISVHEQSHASTIMPFDQILHNADQVPGIGGNLSSCEHDGNQINRGNALHYINFLPLCEDTDCSAESSSNTGNLESDNSELTHEDEGLDGDRKLLTSHQPSNQGNKYENVRVNIHDEQSDFMRNAPSECKTTLTVDVEGYDSYHKGDNVPFNMQANVGQNTHRVKQYENVNSQCTPSGETSLECLHMPSV